VDLDKEILLPALVPVVSSVSLREATETVRDLVLAQQARHRRSSIFNLLTDRDGDQSEKLDANQWDAKHHPKSDNKSETELGLERVETKLRAVQLALEILTGVCATIPDPDPEIGADDEEIEEEVLEDGAVDDSAMDDARDDAMAVDSETPELNSTHEPNVPPPSSSSFSFLPTLLEPLLALIQPTELSFPAPSPHPPTTSALSAIHISALECLSNAFFSLASTTATAAARVSAASDMQAGLRVWSGVWAALAGVGSPVESAPKSARAAVWDVAAGVLWGIGAVWTGKIVRRSVVCSAFGMLLIHGVMVVAPAPAAGSRGSPGTSTDRVV
jgi:hypothetical protein